MIAFCERHTPRREARYPITSPLRFRTEEDGAWYAGTTVNISARGLLFRTAHTPSSGAIELRIALTCEEAPTGAYISCSGRILRTTQVSSSGDVLVAVAIDQGHLRPAARDTPR